MSNYHFSKTSLEKCYFWHGLMSINENNLTGKFFFFFLILIAFFDVKLTKDVPDQINFAGLFTNDLPSIPIFVTDSIRVTITIDNNIGSPTSKSIICEGTFNGSELWNIIETIPQNQNNVTITNEYGDWHFIQQDQFWIIKSFLIYSPLIQLRKFLKDI